MKKIITINSISWLLGLTFYYLFFVYLKNFSYINSFLSLLLALIIFPPSYHFIKKMIFSKFSVILKDFHKLTFLILVFLVFNLVNAKPGNNFLPNTRELNEKIYLDLNNTKENETKTYKVVSVVDGDTIILDIDKELKKVRLIGIDSPELSYEEEPSECYAEEASQKLLDLLRGKYVSIKADHSQDNQDKYARLLRYIYSEDGLFINKWMIENGYANEYTYNAPYLYQEEFKNAEKHAFENKIGIWGEKGCEN